MPDEPRQEDIDELMKVLAASAVPAGARIEPSAPPSAAPMTYEPLSPAAPSGRGDASLEFLGDVNVQVRVELGSSKMNVQEVLQLGSGSIVGLDSLVGDPVNIFVNDRLVARGEVLVVRDNFAVRITEVVPPARSGP
ncbi:MAG TPA: flagellar motor switch protein FliN [Planctomycetota bacterium]|nr:flagellar motor switch protein FliN [Planctomycetota bacterium]